MQSKFKIVKAAVLLILCLYIGSYALAQNKSNQEDSLKTDQINSITIVAKRIVKEIAPVQVLHGEQLQKLSAYSVADAVRYFSGIQIKDYGGIGGLKTVNVRSLGSNHVGVFYDGIELGNAQNGVVDLGKFSLDNMEAISVYNGQKSAIFQPAKDYASSSAVYLQTKVPYFYSDKRDNINVGVKGGSFGTINPSVLWEHKINDKLSVSSSAEYMYTTGKYKFNYKTKGGYDTTETRKNGDVRMERVELALFGKMNKGEWKVKSYFYDSERGYPGASVREEPGKFRHQDRQWDDNFFVQATLRQDFTERYNLLFNIKYAYDYLHYLSDPREDVTTMYVDNHFKQQETYSSLAHLFNITDWWSASLSNDFQWNKLNADLVDFAYPDRYSLLSALATSISTEHIKFQASLLHTFIDDKTKIQGAQAGTKSKFTPSVIFSYKPFSQIDLSIRSFYKRIFRMPTFNDLYYTFIGNKNLNPEYTTQYDVGVVYRKNFKSNWFRGIEAQVDGYYNIVDDKIVAMPTSNQFRWTMMNFGHVKIKGVDVALQGNFKIYNTEWSTHLTYTYQKAQDFTDKSSQWYGGQIPYIPWHNGTVIISGNYKDWNFNYSFIYTGERYEAVANIEENYAQPWYTHDFGVGKSFSLAHYFKSKPFSDAKLKLTAEINNIFNQQYEVVQCYPMPGTNFKIKLNLIF